MNNRSNNPFSDFYILLLIIMIGPQLLFMLLGILQSLLNEQSSSGNYGIIYPCSYKQDNGCIIYHASRDSCYYLLPDGTQLEHPDGKIAKRITWWPKTNVVVAQYRWSSTDPEYVFYQDGELLTPGGRIEANDYKLMREGILTIYTEGNSTLKGFITSNGVSNIEGKELFPDEFPGIKEYPNTTKYVNDNGYYVVKQGNIVLNEGWI